MRSVFYKLLAVLIIFSNDVIYSANTDSLKQQIRLTKDDTLRIKLLVKVGEKEAIFRIGYWDSIRLACEAGLNKQNFSTRSFYQKHLSLAINNIGYVADEQGDMALALDSYLKSEKLCREINDRIGLGKALNNIGTVYEDMGDVVNAMDYYHKSLKIREEINDQKGVAVCFNNIGFIYYKQKDYEKALKYYQSGLDILTRIDHQQLISISYNNIGLVHKKRNNNNSALDFFIKGRAIQKEIGDDFNFLQTNRNVGLIYEDRKRYDIALTYYEENLVLSQKLNYKKGIALSMFNIANVYFLTGKTDLARENAERSYKLFQELGFPEFISSSSLLLSQIYERTGNFKGAYQMHVLHQTMNDSINSIENKKASIQKELQYNYEKKAAADSVKILLERNETQLKIKQEKNQRYYSYVGLAGLLLFSVIIFNRLKLSRKQNRIIEEQKRQVELKNDEVTQQKQIVDEKQKEIIDSINYAKRIQHAVLTGDDVWSKVSKDHFILFKPKDIVSGDFYWAYNASDNCSVFALADCTGHGVPGGFMSMLGNSFLNEIIVENKVRKADEILNKLRAKIIAALEQKGGTQQKDGMDISLCVWNKQNNILEFSGANNPLWRITHVIEGNNDPITELIEYKADKMPIGLYLDNEKPFSSITIQLKKGDVIYLCTDGYADQFGGPKGKKLKYKPLMEMLIRNSGKPMSVQKEMLEIAFEEWKTRYEQVDDVSIIGIRV